MCMFFRRLQPRFAQHLTGVPFQDFRSLVQALFNVDDGVSRGLWLDTTLSPNTKGKRVVGSFESYGSVCSASSLLVPCAMQLACMMSKMP